MNIVDFIAPQNRQTVDSHQVADIPQPSELPAAAKVDPPLGQLLEQASKGVNRQLGNLLRVQPPAEKLTSLLLTGATAQADITAFSEQLEGQRIRGQIWAQQVDRTGTLMAHVQQTLSEAEQDRLIAAQQHVWAELDDKAALPGNIADALDRRDAPPGEFFGKLRELIELIKNSYLAVYQHIIDGFTRFFGDFNQAITAKLKDWIEGVKDGKEVKLDVGQLAAALRTLVRKYSPPNPAAVLFPAPGMSNGASRAEAQKWLAALGLPAESLRKNTNGTYSVVMDLSPLNTMISQLPTGASVTWDSARFQSWQTGFNAQEERLKNMLQSFTQKYSNANAYHDNFNKILSSHLSQYAEMLRAMLNI
ncbi:IpaD/SipD/SspD family type III secretion system needle tip protein [Pseudomonas sp. S2_E01]